MPPGVMPEHALSKHTDSKAIPGSEQGADNANFSNHNRTKDRVRNGNGGIGEGDHGKKQGKEREVNTDEEDVMDMSVLAPALPKITQGFYPFKMLIGRLVQDSKNQLDELIRNLQDAREMDRRQQLMAHVTERRQQFIKLLVLSIWAKRADEVSRVIDVKAWFDSVEAKFQQAIWESFALRRDLANAKYIFQCYCIIPEVQTPEWGLTT